MLGVFENLPEIQLVLSVRKNVDPDELGLIRRMQSLSVPAPQIELLRRARLCITHAGLKLIVELSKRTAIRAKPMCRVFVARAVGRYLKTYKNGDPRLRRIGLSIELWLQPVLSSIKPPSPPNIRGIVWVVPVLCKVMLPHMVRPSYPDRHLESDPA